MYRTVTFQSAGGVDWTFDAQGNPVTPGGRALAISIATGLASGNDRVSNVEQREYYGWEFTCQVDQDVFSQVLNAVDTEVYLTVQMEWYFAKRLLLRRPRVAFDRYCERLGTVLARISGVTGVRWDGYSR